MTAVRTAPLLEVQPPFGNLTTSFVESDLQRLGLAIGDQFQVQIGDSSIEVVLGKDFSDVARGKWVALLMPAGTLSLAMNFSNAAQGVRMPARHDHLHRRCRALAPGFDLQVDPSRRPRTRRLPSPSSSTGPRSWRNEDLRLAPASQTADLNSTALAERVGNAGRGGIRHGRLHHELLRRAATLDGGGWKVARPRSA